MLINEVPKVLNNRQNHYASIAQSRSLYMNCIHVHVLYWATLERHDDMIAYKLVHWTLDNKYKYILLVQKNNIQCVDYSTFKYSWASLHLHVTSPCGRFGFVIFANGGSLVSFTNDSDQGSFTSVKSGSVGRGGVKGEREWSQVNLGRNGIFVQLTTSPYPSCFFLLCMVHVYFAFTT